MPDDKFGFYFQIWILLGNFGCHRVADLVLETPGEISMYPASELARLVGVSNSTVTRFVRRTGFNNHEEMRRSAREARNWGSPLFLAQQADHAPRESAESRLVQFAEQEIKLLQRTLGDLTPSRVDEIATVLAEARNLGFMGFRNSYYFAAYARWQFIQFRDKTRMIPGSGETVAERIAEPPRIYWRILSLFMRPILV